MLIHIVPGASMGGLQRYSLDICRHYAREGQEVVALTRDAKAVDRCFDTDGIRLVHAPLRDYPDFFSSLTLGSLLRTAPKATVIHAHRYRDALTALAARRLARRPDVRIVTTRHKAAPGKDNMLRRLIYRNIDAQIFVSEFARQQFLSTWQRGRLPFDSRRLHVAANSRLEPPGRVAEPERGAMTMMTHGIIRPGKGLETLLEALAIAARSVKLRLRIAGTGNPDYIDTLRQRAERLGVMQQIDWTLKDPDPALLTGSCHFGVQPTEMPEAFGMSNMEYMMAGRPQVTTASGAQREYLTPEVEALFVEPGDKEGLAAAMIRLASDAELRHRMGEAAARRYDRELAWPIFIGKIEEIYYKFEG